jgi:hypothetical protein
VSLFILLLPPLAFDYLVLVDVLLMLAVAEEYSRAVAEPDLTLDDVCLAGDCQRRLAPIQRGAPTTTL